MKKFISMLFILPLILKSAEPIKNIQMELDSNSSSKALSVLDWEGVMAESMRSGNFEQIEQLLKSDVSTKNALHGLIWAMGHLMERELDEKRLQELKIGQIILFDLVKNGADINEIVEGETPLSFASKFGVLPVSQYLILKDADVNLGEDKYAITNVQEDNHLEVLKNSLEIFKLLMRGRVDLNKKDSSGNNLLLKTVINLSEQHQSEKQNIRKQILFLLLLNGADILLSGKDKNRNITFFDFIEKPEIREVVLGFIQNILNNAPEIDKIKGVENALLIAAYFNWDNVVDFLLKKGVWFSSKKYEQFFYNLIADKPMIHEVIKKYKNEKMDLINVHLNRDVSGVVSSYLKI